MRDEKQRRGAAYNAKLIYMTGGQGRLHGMHYRTLPASVAASVQLQLACLGDPMHQYEAYRGWKFWSSLNVPKTYQSMGLKKPIYLAFPMVFIVIY